jgi:ankyrin repeat protein
MGKLARSELILLVNALLNGDIKAVRAQLRGATSVNVHLPQRKNRPARKTPLMLVAKQGYLPIVRLFISLGTNINEANEFRQPSLMYAVRKITYQP